VLRIACKLVVVGEVGGYLEMNLIVLNNVFPFGEQKEKVGLTQEGTRKLFRGPSSKLLDPWVTAKPKTSERIFCQPDVSVVVDAVPYLNVNVVGELSDCSRS
jgi:hypothetical protein